MSKFIGKFTAPGTGDVGVLSVTVLAQDFNAGVNHGVVRLEKRPYWEGVPTPFTLEMPARDGHDAMSMTGFWVERGDFDGEGCDITVVNIKPIPATPTLDELTDPADLDWGALRSAADDRRDWREAWGIVGTDHSGDATPGEVYLLSVARHKSATAAALYHWRELRERVIPLGKGNLSWQRIKGIAAWESSARAQYKPRTKSAWQRRAEWLNERIRPGDLHIPNEFQQEYQGIPAPVDALTYALRALYNPEDDAMTRGNGGVVGVLNNPYLSAAAQRGEITGTMTLAAATRTIATVRAATRETSRQIDALTRTINPAPRGPQTRRRR